MPFTPRKLCLSVVLLFSFHVSGCGTLLGRGDQYRVDGGLYSHPYAGVRFDGVMIYYGEFVQGTKSPVLRLVALIDLPLSAAIDTVLFPVDVGLWIFRGPPERSAEESPTPREVDSECTTPGDAAGPRRASPGVGIRHSFTRLGLFSLPGSTAVGRGFMKE